MYKKASRIKLRVSTKYGNLAVEQLWDLKLTDLATIIKNLAEQKKKFNTNSEELAFLDGVTVNKEEELVNLQFEIVKDVYLTKQAESQEAVNAREKKKEIARLEEILAKKKDAELENLSVEELEKRIKAMM